MDTLKISILIADTDLDFARKLKKALEKESLFSAVILVESGVEMFHEILRLTPKPDIVIIDYYLTGINALSLIKHSHKYMDPPGIPYIVTLPFFDDRACTNALRLGASAYYIKETDFKELIKIIFDLLGLKQEISLPDQAPISDATLKDNIYRLLIYAGAKRGKGTNLLTDAIFLCAKDETILVDITNRLYQELISGHYSSTTVGYKEKENDVASISTNIGHVIKKIWKNNCFASMDIHFKIEGNKKKPSNPEFIGKVAKVFRENPNAFIHLTSSSIYPPKMESKYT